MCDGFRGVRLCVDGLPTTTLTGAGALVDVAPGRARRGRAEVVGPGAGNGPLRPTRAAAQRRTPAAAAGPRGGPALDADFCDSRPASRPGAERRTATTASSRRDPALDKGCDKGRPASSLRRASPGWAWTHRPAPSAATTTSHEPEPRHPRSRCGYPNEASRSEPQSGSPERHLLPKYRSPLPLPERDTAPQAKVVAQSGIPRRDSALPYHFPGAARTRRGEW